MNELESLQGTQDCFHHLTFMLSFTHEKGKTENEKKKKKNKEKKDSISFYSDFFFFFMETFKGALYDHGRYGR